MGQEAFAASERLARVFAQGRGQFARGSQRLEQFRRRRCSSDQCPARGSGRRSGRETNPASFWSCGAGGSIFSVVAPAVIRELGDHLVEGFDEITQFLDGSDQFHAVEIAPGPVPAWRGSATESAHESKARAGNRRSRRCSSARATPEDHQARDLPRGFFDLADVLRRCQDGAAGSALCISSRIWFTDAQARIQHRSEKLLRCSSVLVRARMLAAGGSRTPRNLAAQPPVPVAFRRTSGRRGAAGCRVASNYFSLLLKNRPLRRTPLVRPPVRWLPPGQ